ncbi:MAG TPA: hypothetical protein VIO14_03325 [Dehalococcoidia bacterium]
MGRIRTVILHSTGVVLVPSPRYLRYPLLDGIDELMARGVADDAAFWDRVRVRFDLAEREIPRLQADLAGKYRRDLRLWSALPEVRASHRLVLFDTGSPAVWGHLRRANHLDQAFDVLVNAAEAGLPVQAAEAYPALLARLGLEPAACLVVDASAPRLEAAEAAGCRVLRYGTPRSLRQAIVTA